MAATDRQRWMFILWPAFLAACALEAVVFAIVDPAELHWFRSHLALPPSGVYTVAFFGFLAITIGACYLTYALAATAREDHRMGVHSDV
ncbi:MAG: hypothetical protein ACRCV9_18665 [Burkholderiaceae bacterium]